MRLVWLLCFVATCAAAQVPAQTGLKLGDFPVRDPFILAHAESKTYYLYKSVGPNATPGKRGGVVAYKSKDLENWEGPHVVFEIPDGIWANPANGPAAPEVHAYKGKYYLFTSLRNREKRIDPQPEWPAIYPKEQVLSHMQATQIFVSDSPDGPFKVLGDGKLPTPEDFRTLDGTLFVEDSVPYLVYVHEWLQLLDGTMEAIRLKPDLSAADGQPFYLFKASDAPWLQEQQKVSKGPRFYVTDGPQLYRTRTGKLIMLWSSYCDDVYVETIAYSVSGKLRGPWRQAERLVGNATGHGMAFQAFDGRLMFIAHQPNGGSTSLNSQAKPKLFELEDTGDTFRIKRQVAVAAPPAAQPPVKSGLKLADFRAHDPCILADQPSRTYYLYTSVSPREAGVGRSAVVAYKSRDLETWEGPRIVFTVPDGTWAKPTSGIWAPEVHAFRGKYYLFATWNNEDAVIDRPPVSWRITTRRATQISVSDSPEGPFKPVGDKPPTPEDFMTLDGTLYVEDGVPYMVYAHEWIQMVDGTMEAVEMRDDLTAAAGEPFHLFKASDAPWLVDNQRVGNAQRTYVTDGPFFYRTKSGRLLMIWSSWKNDPEEAARLKVPPRRQSVYMETVAYSVTGTLRGPWKQAEPLLADDSGHGMIFRTFDGRLMLVAHHPTMSPASRATLWELEDTGDTIRIKR